MTDTPGIPGFGDLPTWLTEAVPGLTTALEQTTCVLGVGDYCDSLGDAVCKRFDVAQTWTDELRRHTAAVDGELQPLDASD